MENEAMGKILVFLSYVLLFGVACYITARINKSKKKNEAKSEVIEWGELTALGPLRACTFTRIHINRQAGEALYFLNERSAKQHVSKVMPQVVIDGKTFDQVEGWHLQANTNRGYLRAINGKCRVVPITLFQ